jgi:hypothetical protein
VGPALSLQPDLLIMALSPHDLEITGDDVLVPTRSSTLGIGTFNRMLLAAAVQLRKSRAVAVAQHFLYENLEVYLPLYLKHSDEADYLRPPLSLAWRRRLELFDRLVAEIATRSKAVNVRFMLLFVPQRAQAALTQWKHSPPGIDPFLLGDAIGQIAKRNGALYVDLTRTIVANGTVRDLYYAVDSHPNGMAGAVIAEAIVSSMTTLHVLPTSCTGQSQAFK